LVCYRPYLEFPAEDAIKKAYIDIRQYLNEMGRPIHNFPSLPVIDTGRIVRDIAEIDVAEEEKIYTEMYKTMNGKQKRIMTELIRLLEDKTAYVTLPNGRKTRCVFIAGAGGVGKTYIYIALYHYSRWKGYSGHNTSYSGIAANLLPEGRTLHNLFKLPVPVHADSNSSIEPGKKEATDLIESDYILIDEAPTVPKYAIEIASRKLQELSKTWKKRPFADHLIIMGGDFAQTLPVMKGGSRSQQVDLSIKRSPLWDHFVVYELTDNMRADPDAQEFAQFIRNVGLGLPNYPHERAGRCRLPEDRCTEDNLPEKIFKPILQ
jgi:PIF1-like helicase